MLPTGKLLWNGPQPCKQVASIRHICVKSDLHTAPVSSSRGGQLSAEQDLNHAHPASLLECVIGYYHSTLLYHFAIMHHVKQELLNCRKLQKAESDLRRAQADLRASERERDAAESRAAAAQVENDKGSAANNASAAAKRVSMNPSKIAKIANLLQCLRTQPIP